MEPRSSPPPLEAIIPSACKIILPPPPPRMPAREFPNVPKLCSLSAAPAILPPTAPLRRLIIKETISIRPSLSSRRIFCDDSLPEKDYLSLKGCDCLTDRLCLIMVQGERNSSAHRSDFGSDFRLTTLGLRPQPCNFL